MATPPQHAQKAEQNENFVTFLLSASAPFLDWAVTGLFYSALHYCRAVMANYGFTNISTYAEMDNHFVRLSALKKRPDVFADYRQLKDDSRAARYDMWAVALKDVTDLQANEFARVRKFARGHLKLP